MDLKNLFKKFTWQSNSGKRSCSTLVNIYSSKIYSIYRFKKKKRLTIPGLAKAKSKLKMRRKA